MNTEFEFEFGDKVKHIVLEFEGIIRAMDTWYTGCKRCAVQRPIKKDESVPDLYWAEEVDLKLIKKSTDKIDVPRSGPHDNVKKLGVK